MSENNKNSEQGTVTIQLDLFERNPASKSTKRGATETLKLQPFVLANSVGLVTSISKSMMSIAGPFKLQSSAITQAFRFCWSIF